MTRLKFSKMKHNAKLALVKGKGYTFSLPAGHSCPFAHECLAKAHRDTGKITEGKKTVFRCFSASTESVFPNSRHQRWHNFSLLKGVRTSLAMAILIQDSLPTDATIVRVHVSGDFFSQAYFNAWMIVARNNPGVKFYAYTKSLTYWVNAGTIPSNFVLTASEGGKHDYLIALHNLRFARVVFTEQHAIEAGLEIDHDDSHAMENGPSFALLLHGKQSKGSPAAKALSALKGKGSYSR